MAASSQIPSSQAIVNNYAKQGLHKCIRTGNLFVIHFTEEMFRENGCGNVYFHQCLQTYINILKRNLANNRDDYMGLMFCNTKESDEGAENVTTVLKLNASTTNMYTDIMKIYEEDIENYKNQISDTDCSIANILLHAARTYDTISSTTMTHTVILITCDDNPASNDSKEQHRIRLIAKNFKNINVQLKIVGLGKEWDYDRFYKEIEMLSERTAGRDFKRMDLSDLEEDIMYKAHVMASLEFRIKNGAKIKISLQAFITRRRNIKTKSLGKGTNEPLDHYNCYLYEPEEEDGDFDRENTPENLFKMQRYGDRDIVFTCNEVRSLFCMRKLGMDLIGFKPMIRDDPTYQIRPPLFMGCDAKSSPGDLKFFAALLSKMANANLMAICALTLQLNAKTRLYIMWPSVDLGGFYLFAMPFKEEVRLNVVNVSKKYVFDEDENPAPITEGKVDVMKSIVSALCIEKYPVEFHNHRYQRILKSVEAVALDLPPVELPKDDTLPDLESMRNKLNEMNLIDQYHDTFEEIEEPVKAGKRGEKVRRLDDDYVNDIMNEGNFSQLTAVTLKSVLRSLGLSSSGKKADLVNKLEEYKKDNS